MLKLIHLKIYTTQCRQQETGPKFLLFFLINADDNMVGGPELGTKLLASFSRANELVEQCRRASFAQAERGSDRKSFEYCLT